MVFLGIVNNSGVEWSGVRRSEWSGIVDSYKLQPHKEELSMLRLSLRLSLRGRNEEVVCV